MTSALALSSLLLMIAAAAPKGGNGSAAAKLQAGQTEFRRGDFLSALRTLDAAAAETTDQPTLAKIHLLRGQCFAARQDFAAAEQAFALALEYDPETTLDPSKVDPAVVRMLDGLRNRLRGELRVRADKPGAQVSVDGKLMGQVPLRSNVSIGRHSVDVRSLDGLFGASREIVVRLKQPADLSLQLTQLPARPRGSGGEKGAGPRSSEEGPRPFADLRAALDPFTSSSTLGFEVGGGIEYQHLRGSVNAIIYPDFGLAPRGTLSVPVEERFDAYASLEIPIIFAGSAALGLGGAGGGEYELSRWFGAFLEVGARHFFTGVGDANPNRLILQLGIRLRLP